MNVVSILRIILIVWVIIAAIMLAIDMKKHADDLELKSSKTVKNFLIGFIANFFDTWGIGSFAPSTFAYKTFKSCKDDLIPGSLNVGDTFPVVVEAVLFLEFVNVDPVTLVAMLAAAALGAFIGAGIVSKMNVNTIRIGMGIALVCCAIIFVCKLLGVGPFGLVGTATGVTGIKLVVAIVVNFFLGSLMMIGFGLYQPCMALVMILGMDIGVAFPVMMGSCAVLMLTSVPKFIQTGKYDKNATLMNAVGGSIGAVAAYITLKYAFDLTTLSYIVCVVMLYTAIRMFLDAKNNAA